MEDRLLLSAFTVLNTGDNGGVNPVPFAGTGTLRQAIIDANATPGTDNILFDIPGTDPHTITVQVALPTITNPVNILGNTQPGFGQGQQPFSSLRDPAAPVITIYGRQAGSGTNGLTLNDGSNGSQITCLSVEGFGKNGVVVNNSASNTLFDLVVRYNSGNGLVFTDSLAQGNYLQGSVSSDNGGDGVLLSNLAHNNFLGVGTSFPATNSIARNHANGVHILNASANVLVGNNINANSGDGILVEGNDSYANRLGAPLPVNDTNLNYYFPGYLTYNGPGPGPSTNNSDLSGLNFGSGGLRVTGNASNGIEIRGYASDTIVQNASIGVSSSQFYYERNAGDGLLITTSGRGTMVSHNRITGNTGNGVEIAGNAHDVTIEDNTIGLDGTANEAVPNIGDGILVHGNARNIVIGTPVPYYVGFGFGGCNLIGANKGNGITVAGNAAEVNIGNNRIGVGAILTKPLGNQGDGIAITSDAGNNVIQPRYPTNAGNIIAFNQGNGVRVTGGNRTSILSNEIYANRLVGIALTQGGNNARPAPIVQAAYNIGNQLVVTGTVSGPANVYIHIQLFDNNPASPGAMVWLDDVNVRTDSTGRAAFTDWVRRPVYNYGGFVSYYTGPQHYTVTVPKGHIITATATDQYGNTSQISEPITVGEQTTVTGSDVGHSPEVKAFLSDSTQVLDFMAYDPNFTGGVRVAVGDVNGDEIPDIVTAPGPGGGPDIKVFDGQNAALLAEFTAFDATFTGGVYVAAADINHDGLADIICGADVGGGPNVVIYNAAALVAQRTAYGYHVPSYFGYPSYSLDPPPATLANFFPFDPNFTGGVRVAAADFNSDGYADVVAAAGPGGGPSVSIYDGKALATSQTLTSLAAFFAFAPEFTGGSYVSSGDFNGDRTPDLAVAAGAGGGPNVVVLDGKTLAPNSTPDVLANFFAYAPDFIGGVRIVLTDLNDDGKADIVTTADSSTEAGIRVFDAATLDLLDNVFAGDSSRTGGVYLAAASGEPD